MSTASARNLLTCGQLVQMGRTTGRGKQSNRYIPNWSIKEVLGYPFDEAFSRAAGRIALKPARRRIDVNLAELDRVLDGARDAPLSESDQGKLRDVGQVYLHHAEACECRLTPEERLRLHQVRSRPVMDKLHAWLEAQLAERRTEPNSALGQATSCLRRHWQPLTLFLRKAAPRLISTSLRCH